MSNVSVKRRETGEAKAIRGFKTGGQEVKGSKEMIPYKFWKMLYPDVQALICSGGEEKIRLVTEGGVKASSHGGGKYYKTNKGRRNRLLLLCTVDGKQSPSAAKDLDDLLASVGKP